MCVTLADDLSRHATYRRRCCCFCCSLFSLAQLREKRKRERKNFFFLGWELYGFIMASPVFLRRDTEKPRFLIYCPPLRLLLRLFFLLS